MHFSIFHCVLTLQDVFNHTSIWEHLPSSEMKDTGLRVLILFLKHGHRGLKKNCIPLFGPVALTFLFYCSVLNLLLFRVTKVLLLSLFLLLFSNTLPYLALPCLASPRLAFPYLFLNTIRLIIGVDLWTSELLIWVSIQVHTVPSAIAASLANLKCTVGYLADCSRHSWCILITNWGTWSILGSMSA